MNWPLTKSQLHPCQFTPARLPCVSHGHVLPDQRPWGWHRNICLRNVSKWEPIAKCKSKFDKGYTAFREFHECCQEQLVKPRMHDDRAVRPVNNGAADEYVQRELFVLWKNWVLWGNQRAPEKYFPKLNILCSNGYEMWCSGRLLHTPTQISTSFSVLSVSGWLQL